MERERERIWLAESRSLIWNYIDNEGISSNIKMIPKRNWVASIHKGHLVTLSSQNQCKFQNFCSLRAERDLQIAIVF
jgi:hypothetical protein